jgi:hypothetical protein
VDLHRNALAHLVFVHCRTERGNSSHVLMTRGESLVERQCAVDERGRAIGDDIQVGSTNGHGIDANEHFGSIGNRDLLLVEAQLAGLSECPRQHPPRRRSGKLQGVLQFFRQGVTHSTTPGKPTTSRHARYNHLHCRCNQNLQIGLDRQPYHGISIVLPLFQFGAEDWICTDFSAEYTEDAQKSYGGETLNRRKTIMLAARPFCEYFSVILKPM